MADEDDEKFLYGGGDSETKEPSVEIKQEPTEDESVTENGQTKDEDDAKEAGELSNEDDDEDDDDDDDEDDVQVTIGEINTSAAPYGAPYAPPVNWNFKAGGASAAAKDRIAGSKDKHIDVDAVGTVNGVSVHEFDLDSVDDKPWRKPGADITDYFNYGFTEDTWKQYCEKQRRMRMELQMPKKIFVHPPPPVDAGMMPDGRPRKAGPPPERKLEGSIDVIGGEGSRVESRRRREDDVMMPMMAEGMNPEVGPRPGMMNKRHFPPGPPGGPHGMPPVSGAPPFMPPRPDPAMGPPTSGAPIPIHVPPGGPVPPGMPPPFRPMGGPDGRHHPEGAPPGMPPPGMPPMPVMGGPPPHGFPPEMGMPPDGMHPPFDPGFPGRPGSMSMRGRGRGRIPVGGPPGVPPGMPPSGEFPQGIDERGPRPFEEGAPFFPGDPNQPFHPMMGPPPGMAWEPGMGRGFPPGFREGFPGAIGRQGSESPGDDDSEFGSSDEDRKRDRDSHRRRDRDRERTREHRERNRDRDRSPRKERDRDRDRERRDRERRHRDRDKGGDRERREERSSRKDRDKSKEQREKKRHSKTAGSETSGGPEEGELVPTKKKSRRTRETKEPKNENTEPREEGQRTPTP